MILRQYGLLGYLRVFKRDNCIVETRRGATPFKRDLHLNSPWPELTAFANRFDFMQMEINEHIHTPYICILLQALDKWKAEHDGQVPKNMQEKKAFKELLAPMNRFRSAQSNFDEAEQAIYDCYHKPVPDNVTQICDHPSVETGANSFWIYLAGLKRFI
jgi:amyloid beta precursor protein binding protein 1